MENIVSEPAVKYNRLSPQDYLAAERLSAEKHEYFEGEVIVMQGASLRHERIVANVVREIGNKLRSKSCEIFPSNLRTASPAFLSFTYPDATIVCGEPLLSDDNFDVLQNPVVIFEVVSKTSVNHDYIKKFLYYRQIPSLQEYVLINSFEMVHVDIYRRNPNNTWTIETYSNLGDSLVLKSVTISVPLQDIYENVVFDLLPNEEGLI
jgi:Uma2 family endonuclease